MSDDIVAELDRWLRVEREVGFTKLGAMVQRARDEIVATNEAIGRATKEAYALGRAEERRSWLPVVERAQADERERLLGMLRHPTSDMLNRGADEIRRDVDPVQRRVRFLLDVMADMVAFEIARKSGERTS